MTDTRSRYTTEAHRLFLIAWPIIIAQIAQTGMGFVDTLMAGRYGATDLAAIAIGASFWLPVFLAASGVLMATTPLVAHLVGSNQLNQSRDVFIQGLVISLGLSALSICFLYNADYVLEKMSVEAALAIKIQAYLKAIAWGFPAILIYQVIRSYSEGFGKTRPIMKISVFALAANIPLNYIFIYGKLGLPEMGGVGCGWATAIVMWIMLLCGLGYLRLNKTFASYQLFSKSKRPDTSDLKNFLKLGLPIGLALLVEVSMFSIIALLLADLGKTIVGAHQITISFTGLVFMIPLSISMALTIRVGHLLGSKDLTGARSAALTGVYMTLICATISSSTMFMLAHQIAGLYTDELQIISLAVTLISIAALFQFSDAIQVACAGILRGYKDTQGPLVIVLIAYWIIGLPLGLMLGKTDWIVTAMGAKGFWVALCIALSIAALLLGWRLLWRIRTYQADTGTDAAKNSLN